MKKRDRKAVIYQVLPRLFGNLNTTNSPWGTIEENGVGKFNDFTDEALKAISDLGVTHIWYTGVLHHGVIRDYTKYGISNDDPDIVKGRAGSPYAVKDYYNVDPDLAVNPERRLEEFEALIQRTHNHGLQVIIDIIPNHVARNYHSVTNPEGVVDFGINDNVDIEFNKNNNFYYIPGERFEVPDYEDGFLPLGGEEYSMAGEQFNEFPAKWTGNGSREAKPSQHDWYETVKLNFGVAPDGSYCFDSLPEGYNSRPIQDHYEFWLSRDIPDTWKKFEQIAHYWIDKGVDGFRYDMAQMVPVEFWSFLNSSIKIKKPDAVLISEIYIPELYRDYIYLGKMDFLYDKVELYDTLKNVITGQGSTDMLPAIIEHLSDIEHYMLHFLENHDELRLASQEFAGDARKGMSGMVISATIGTSPTMIYFGQELGEKGEGDTGYGKHGRTTIYDYWGMPAHQRWMNGGTFDGGGLSNEEKELREFYKILLNFSIHSSALMGRYSAIHIYNRQNTKWYSDKLFSFLRYDSSEKLLIIVSFDYSSAQFELKIPEEKVKKLQLKFGEYHMEDMLKSGKEFKLIVRGSGAVTTISIDPLESFILKIC